MAKLKDIVRFCDDYLQIEKFKDSSFNGLQVEGQPEVKKIALGVSCNLELFEKAADWEAKAVLTHHGILWEGRWQYLRGFQKNRVKFLLDRGISLLAYHLPLDAHPKIGNNALGLQKMGAKIAGGFGVYEGQTVGFWGRLPKKIKFREFLKKINQVFGAESWYIDGGKPMVETVAFVSGGAHRMLEEAIEKEIDVYVDGETNESRPALAAEAGIHFIAPGHYNTEKFGVIELGKLLEKKFKVETKFIDIPNQL